MAISDPSVKRDAADGDHFCKCSEWTDGHLAKPDIVCRSVDSSWFLSFPVVGSNAMTGRCRLLMIGLDLYWNGTGFSESSWEKGKAQNRDERAFT